MVGWMNPRVPGSLKAVLNVLVAVAFLQLHGTVSQTFNVTTEVTVVNSSTIAASTPIPTTEVFPLSSLNPPTINCSGFNASLCNSCTPGYYANTTAFPDCHCCQEFGQEGQCQSSCQKCRPGHYQPNNSSISCLKCPIGHNSSTFGNPECSACKPGFFANTTGMAVCLPCLPGTFTNKTKSSQCQKCAKGHKQPEMRAEECHECEIGSFCNQTGCKQCYPCPAGTEAKFLGMSVCQDCTPGFYKGTDNIELCVPCSAGWYQLGYGSEACEECPAGSFCPCATCEPKKCKPEEYCPAGSSEPSTCGDINLYYKDPNTQACRPTVLLIALIAAGCAACLALVIGGTLSVYCKKRRIPKEKSSSTETHRLLDTEEKSEEPVYQGL
ncbi:Si dkey-21a6.5 [Branchiostoma belcheri]|nr:Si dkey-21a6.5 [Branchiostoma belcheri]